MTKEKEGREDTWESRLLPWFQPTRGSRLITTPEAGSSLRDGRGPGRPQGLGLHSTRTGTW